MLNKVLYTVVNHEVIQHLKKEGIKNFLFPFSDYCVGFEVTFKISEIKEDQSYLYLNRLLDTEAIENLKSDLANLPKHIKGIILEDLGVYEIIKELNINCEIILYQQHFGTNLETINSQLTRFDSLVIATDITKAQIEFILANANKPLCVNLFSLIPVMYSRRLLISNYQDHFSLEKKKIICIQETVTKKNFIAIENQYGTVLYYDHYYNGLAIKSSNIKFYLINPLFLTTKEQLSLIQNIKNNQPITIEYDFGFLETKTIYRVKGA